VPCDRPRAQTRWSRPRRRCRCRPRACSGTSLTSNADTPLMWRLDTRPCTTGRRSARWPASARPRIELRETRYCSGPPGARAAPVWKRRNGTRSSPFAGFDARGASHPAEFPRQAPRISHRNRCV
jgi:hypothetical protein